jgi:hypothetical protein
VLKSHHHHHHHRSLFPVDTDTRNIIKITTTAYDNFSALSTHALFSFSHRRYCSRRRVGVEAEVEVTTRQR